MLDLDIGMNDWLCEPLPAGTTAARYDRGKVMTAEELDARQDLRPLSRRRRRRHSLPHLSRHPSHQGRLLHPRHLAATATPTTPRKARSTSTTCSACCASSRRAQGAGAGAAIAQGASKRPRCGVIYFGSTAPAMHEALAIAGRRRHAGSTRMRMRAFPFTDAVLDFITAHDQSLRGRAEPRRARCASLLVNEVRHRPGAS